MNSHDTFQTTLSNDTVHSVDILFHPSITILYLWSNNVSAGIYIPKTLTDLWSKWIRSPLLHFLWSCVHTWSALIIYVLRPWPKDTSIRICIPKQRRDLWFSHFFSIVWSCVQSWFSAVLIQDWTQHQTIRKKLDHISPDQFLSSTSLWPWPNNTSTAI